MTDQDPAERTIAGFSRCVFEQTDALNAFAREVRFALSESPLRVKYPESLHTRGCSVIDWKGEGQNIRALNKGLLDSVSGKAGVYAIYAAAPQQDWIIQYVGQSGPKTCRARICAHLVWRNKETPSGRFTGSKFDEVQHAVSRRRHIAFSFVEVDPASLRHYVESYLISKLRPEWNFHGVDISRRA